MLGLINYGKNTNSKRNKQLKQMNLEEKYKKLHELVLETINHLAEHHTNINKAIVILQDQIDIIVTEMEQLKKEIKNANSQQPN